MKNLILIISVLAWFNAGAQKTDKSGAVKTATIAVRGNCDDCKDRIENAADIKGVKRTDWNADAQVATVTYDTTKTTLEKIKTAIASRGHDAGEMKAPEKVYRRLPECCQYRDNKCEEPK